MCQKHGVSFSEAQTVLEDVDALYRNDPDSADEDRWIVIGLSHRYRVLLVVTWEAEDGAVLPSSSSSWHRVS